MDRYDYPLVKAAADQSVTLEYEGDPATQTAAEARLST
jgi:hypothetical protein